MSLPPLKEGQDISHKNGALLNGQRAIFVYAGINHSHSIVEGGLEEIS